MSEDSNLEKVLQYFLTSYKDRKGVNVYYYGFGLASDEKHKLVQSVLVMLGIVERLGSGTRFNPQRINQVVDIIYDVLNDPEVRFLTAEEAEQVNPNEINNFFVLAQVNTGELAIVNNQTNINMFGPTTIIEYQGALYAIPEHLLNNGTNNKNLIFSKIVSMIIYMMRLAQQDNISQGSRVKKIDNNKSYLRNTVKMNDSEPNKPLTNVIFTLIGGTLKQPKPASNITPPPIQPETGQSEDVRPDPNLQQYAEAVNPDFIKTHDTVEQPVVRLELDIITKGFEDELDEVDRELLQQANQEEPEQPVENPDRRLAVIPEPRNVVNLEELVDEAVRQYMNPQIVELIARTMYRTYVLENPMNFIDRLPDARGIVFRSGTGSYIDLTGFNENDNDDEPEQINRKIVADVMSKNPLFFKSELLKEILLSFARFVASTYRGSVNLVDRVIQNDLLPLDTNALKIAIEGVKHQLELYAINHPELVFTSVVIGAGPTSFILSNALYHITGLILNTLGITGGPGVFVDVDNVIIIKDMNGNTLRVIDGGEVNFSPDPISSQTGYQVVLEPNSYQIEKNIPSREEVQQAKSTFDAELYNFIGNRMLSVSKLNMEPTYIQPGYSLLFNISTEIDTLYTALVQGDKTAIDQFLPKYNKFLVENKQVILNHVNQPYYPGPDPDPEDDDEDVGSGDSGSPFPKKPNKFADSKEGEWYIIKTLIYWLMRHVAKIYDYTSVHMQNLFLISQEIASSIYTTIIGRHPYLFTTGIALTLLEPQFIPQIYDTFVAVFQGILSVTKSVFSFLSSTAGLVVLGIGAFVLLYTFANSSKKFSLF